MTAASISSRPSKAVSTPSWGPGTFVSIFCCAFFLREIMTRTDQHHVSLYASNTPKCETKKLRKRRELNAMVAPHVRGGHRGVKRGILTSGGGSSSVQPSFLASTSSSESHEDDDDEDDFNDNPGVGHAYINLAQKSSKGGSNLWKRHPNGRCLGVIRGMCLCFVIISGFLVLMTLLWLHFALRTQTQELSAQLYQGWNVTLKNEFKRWIEDFFSYFSVLEDKVSNEKSQDDLENQLSNLVKNQSILYDNLTKIISQVEVLSTQVRNQKSIWRKNILRKALFCTQCGKYRNLLSRIYWIKFRESNVFDVELISRNIFSVRVIFFSVFPHHTVGFTKFLYHDFLKNFRENNFFSKEFTI